jgi:hypothetical protein
MKNTNSKESTITRQEILMNTNSKESTITREEILNSNESTITPSKRKLHYVPILSKRPLTERQTERSETLHNMYNSMAQIDKPGEGLLKDYLGKAVENLNDLDHLEFNDLVKIQADLISIMSIITQRLLQ